MPRKVRKKRTGPIIEAYAIIGPVLRTFWLPAKCEYVIRRISMGSSVVVVEYDPSWVLLFEQLRDFVLPVLSDLEVRIEHVGSTSVLGPTLIFRG
jgi:hypothetical protein